jgi:hypothetical protein
MTDSEFVIDISTRHAETPAVMLKDLEKWLNGFTEDQIGEIHSRYLISQSSKFSPRSLFDFQAIATENGITKKSDNVTLLWWKCDACGAKFSRQSRGCPKCGGKRFSGVIGIRFPTDIVFVKDGCYTCPIYNSGFRPQGPTCAEYGKIDNGIRRPGQPPQPGMCHGCRCANCCAEEKASHETDKTALNLLTGKTMETIETISSSARGR